jgi:LTXXQ motif family protein
MNKSTLAGAAMITAAALAVPIFAWSQSPPQPPAPTAAPDHPDRGMMPMMHHHGWGHWAENQSPQQACQDRIAKRAGFVAYIGAKLNLTADQKPLWDKVVAATQAAQASEAKTCATLPTSADDRAKETIIDKMNHRQAMMQAQLQGLQQIEPAAQALYQVLTPEQKAMVDHPHHRG